MVAPLHRPVQDQGLIEIVLPNGVSMRLDRRVDSFGPPIQHLVRFR
jgi:hypothetical protein